MSRKIDTKIGLLILVVLTAIILGYIWLQYQFILQPTPRLIFPPTIHLPKIEGIEKFLSEEDFKNYLQKAEIGYMGYMGGGIRAPGFEEIGLERPLMKKEITKEAPERVSPTTVQVLGIDEPDIVKTDGKEIYFSGQSYWRREFYWKEPLKLETKIIKAFPPADLAIEAKIDKRGDLLLYKDVLVIFSGDKIFGFDISDPKSPKEKWDIKLEDENYIVGSRLYKDKIYLITKAEINTYHPCPIKPLSIKGVPLEIKCTDIYHPVLEIPVDVTFNTITFDPISGQIEKTVSFVGSSGLSVIYMSENGIYITYSYYEDLIKFFYNFLKEDFSDIISNYVLESLEKLIGYDISTASKYTEFQIIFERYLNSLSKDERLRVQNEFSNSITDYLKIHQREFEKTKIVKIGLEKLEISATGDISGKLLNQFSLDEYNNYFRVATTTGGRFGMWGMIGGIGESLNDIYVLDKDLKIAGKVENLGLGERIYSVRFLENKGYVVTFKEIDPFFVIDLSNPQKPELKGELKIPGYSSYLHPITKDKILGIGKEGWQVKISFFDVSSPQNPTETDKYILDEGWSDILNTHHAFLLDTKHKIFFLPATKGGYIFSYENDQLKLVKAQSGIVARRAIYINDYLYIIGDDRIVILNEIDWQKVNELEF